MLGAGWGTLVEALTVPGRMTVMVTRLGLSAHL
jgi:hypothetical protein